LSAKSAAVTPNHDILAEENEYIPLNSTHKWIIDPLDGTTNYAHGFPWFGVSIALEIDAVVQSGVIFHPMMNELFTAVRGKGAFLNGGRIHVSRRAPLKNCLLATGFPYDRTWNNENNFANFEKMQMAARAVRRAGAAALDLGYVAAGRLDGYWECKLKPWDVAAGTLLVEEAGGKITDYSLGPYSIYHQRIMASNGLVHDEMAAVLRGTRPEK
jgi:myo-inositol-1(or 4)-monophosphatase